LGRSLGKTISITKDKWRGTHVFRGFRPIRVKKNGRTPGPAVP
jgi:hypothetical protein